MDNRGRIKQPQFRAVPVPRVLIEHLDLVFGIRTLFLLTHIGVVRGRQMRLP